MRLNEGFGRVPLFREWEKVVFLLGTWCIGSLSTAYPGETLSSTEAID
jgi:hypothetical protein